MTPAARENHIRELAAELGCGVQVLHEISRVLNPSAGSAYSGRPPWITLRYSEFTEQCYWTALHELGHIALGHVTFEVSAVYQHDPLNAEAEAWLWAIDHARDSEPDVHYILEETLGSYVRNNALSRITRPRPAFNALHSRLERSTE